MAQTDQLTTKDHAKMAQSATIARVISQGKSVQAAAKEAGVSRRTAYRRLTDDYCQSLIENSLKTQIAAIPGTTKKLIKHAMQSDNDKLSLDAIKTIHENVGIRPSRTTNQFIVNMSTQGGNISMLDPRIMGVIGSALGGLLDSDVEEAEVVDNE